jgi:hypothetical protein
MDVFGIKGKKRAHGHTGPTTMQGLFLAGSPVSMSWILSGEGLDRLAMFYDVYVTRPGPQRQ